MRTLLAVALTALLCTATAATAATLITGRQVKNGSLTGADIKNRSIRKTDLSPSARGAQGPQGATGPAGAQGPAGAPATFRVHTETGAPVFATIGGTSEAVTATAGCASGQTVGGGYEITTNENPGYPRVSILSERVENGRWTVVARNDGSYDIFLRAIATCI